MKAIYCTVMSRPFVPRALALQDSIARHSPDAKFAFYCIDGETAALLNTFELKNAQVFAPNEFETPALRAVKTSLNPGEYCWTCKSVALLHAFATDPLLDWAVWVDSDMFAFADPNQALEAYAGASVVLTLHRFSWPEIAAYEPIVGRFNAGYVAVRNSKEGHAALTWWMRRCLESCSDEPTSENYADQKYLEQMPELFPNVVGSSHVGLNCAPWNVIGQNVAGGSEGVLVSNSPLLLYHFQGLKVVRYWAFDLYTSKMALPDIVRQEVYRPYVTALVTQMRKVAARAEDPQLGIDGHFAGLRGFYLAVKQFVWSRNMVLHFS